MKVKVVQLCLTFCHPMDYTVLGILQARILKWVAFPFPEDLPNPDLLHCRQILYQLSYKGSPRILEWVDYPFSSVSSGSRNQTGVYRIARGFFTDWVIREAHQSGYSPTIKLMQKLYKVPEVRLEIQETVLEIHSTNAECLLCAVNSSLCYTSSENTLNNFNNGCHYSLKD